jgi:hypothetical protein
MGECDDRRHEDRSDGTEWPLGLLSLGGAVTMTDYIAPLAFLAFLALVGFIILLLADGEAEH